MHVHDDERDAAGIRPAATELVRDAAGSSSPIETPGGELPAGENESYEAAPEASLPLNLSLEEGIRRYVAWLQTLRVLKSRD